MGIYISLTIINWGIMFSSQIFKISRNINISSWIKHTHTYVAITFCHAVSLASSMPYAPLRVRKVFA